MDSNKNTKKKSTMDTKDDEEFFWDDMDWEKFWIEEKKIIDSKKPFWKDEKKGMNDLKKDITMDWESFDYNEEKKERKKIDYSDLFEPKPKQT